MPGTGKGHTVRGGEVWTGQFTLTLLQTHLGLLMAIPLLTVFSLPATPSSFQSGSLILSCPFHLYESFPGKVILWTLCKFLNLSVSQFYDLQN